MITYEAECRGAPFLAVLADGGGLVVRIALQEVLRVAVRVDQDLAHRVVHLQPQNTSIGTRVDNVDATPGASACACTNSCMH